ncbi:MAG TPA: pentapeptide repeat-containing protein [Tepidisphaeraceae bacterium]|jgi:uncharacterized protein YjbI with pentapeptide repeats
MSWTVHPGSPGAGGIVPARAPVVPRVRLPGHEAAVPIEQRAREILTRNPSCLMELVGPPGSGKTTAVAHLWAAIGAELSLRIVEKGHHSTILFELHPAPEARTAHAPRRVNATATVRLEMAPWTDDDLAEYLLATHPGRCKAVMLRLRADPDRATLNGLPELWRVVLDEMAADDSVYTIDMAFLRFLDRELGDPGTRAAAEEHALRGSAPWGAVGKDPPAGLGEGRAARLLMHKRVAAPLAARRIAEGLPDRSVRPYLCGRLPYDLVRRVALRARAVPAALGALNAMAEEEDPGAHGTAASILHAAGIGWRPGGERVPNLWGAWLADVQWDGIRLPRCKMNLADLRRASLANADLTGAVLDYAQLARSTCRNAWLRGAIFVRADCEEANLAAVTADGAAFSYCNLKGAILGGASLKAALFRHADLTHAAFRRADLSLADFTGATVGDTDFSGAVMTDARLQGLPLAGCTFGGTSLLRANLSGCNLEGLIADDMNFEDADLSDALLTGSVFRSARFQSADLRGCGLAEIEWEGADLRDADLRQSTFHMGSTRSGLVGSTIPCEGSRTGFYTDEFFETDFKAPEEIRKANLRGADLRGAKIEGVDFYLVDLRDAQYTPEQAEWFHKCKAILSPQ